MIELNDLTIRFDEHIVLDRLCLRIPYSGTTAIFGPSGCGKTTLLRTLAGLIRPSSGAIRGMEGRKPAVVFQEDRLLPWKNALENAAFASDVNTARTYLMQLGLAPAMGLLPKELSGGMRRRVAIARALAYGGDILLLDEPFTGLDQQTRRNTAQAMLRAGLPIVLVTHDPDEAALLNAARILRLDSGGAVMTEPAPPSPVNPAPAATDNQDPAR